MGLLDDRVAVITGAGRGIGQAIALTFVREGACVVINDIDNAPAEETRQLCDQIAAGRAAISSGSVTNSKYTDALMKTAAGAGIVRKWSHKRVNVFPRMSRTNPAFEALRMNDKKEFNIPARTLSTLYIDDRR